MARVSNARLLALWREVQARSNPGLAKDRWQVGDVEWVRQRHGHWGADCSFQLETNLLVRRTGGRIGWRLLAVAERWWGSDSREPVRAAEWMKMLNGRRDDAATWLKEQAGD